MKLADVFTQLTYGELSQLHLGDLVDGKIPREHLAPLLSHINMGLTALHKRFPLRERSIKLLLQSGMLTYRLHSDFAVHSMDSFEDLRYIQDSEADPFVDDIHKIERVYTQSNRELGLNDDSDCYACKTPSYNLLMVPEDIVEQSSDLPEGLKTEYLKVVYRANHPIIKLENGRINPDEAEIELPYSHLEALLYFIASRVNNPIGMVQEFHAGNSWAAKYEMECQRLEQFNLRVDQGEQNTRLQRNGWI